MNFINYFRKSLSNSTNVLKNFDVSELKEEDKARYYNLRESYNVAVTEFRGYVTSQLALHKRYQHRAARSRDDVYSSPDIPLNVATALGDYAKRFSGLVGNVITLLNELKAKKSRLEAKEINLCKILGTIAVALLASAVLTLYMCKMETVERFLSNQLDELASVLSKLSEVAEMDVMKAELTHISTNSKMIMNAIHSNRSIFDEEHDAVRRGRARGNSIDEHLERAVSYLTMLQDVAIVAENSLTDPDSDGSDAASQTSAISDHLVDQVVTTLPPSGPAHNLPASRSDLLTGSSEEIQARASSPSDYDKFNN